MKLSPLKPQAQWQSPFFVAVNCVFLQPRYMQKEM